MTARELINGNPMLEGESQGAYLRRIYDAHKHECDSNLESLTRFFQKIKKKGQVRWWVTTSKKLNKVGEVTSKTQKLQRLIEVPLRKGFEVFEETTNLKNGEQWTKIRKIKESPLKDEITPEILKELVLETLKDFDFSATNKKYFDRSEIYQNSAMLVYTDVHVGMDVNKKGHSLYGGKWDAEELFLRMETMADAFIAYVNNNRVREIVIVDLGDFMDGWDAMTARKGHELPQNMDNKESFKAGLKFKIQLVHRIVKGTGLIPKVINICNDNHSADFGYIVNESAKNTLELMYNGIEITNQERFIGHSKVNGSWIVTCHGKDDKNLKFGFKFNPDMKSFEKIDQYCKHHKLYDGSPIIFMKGDTHMMGFDSSHPDINYFNFPALSPSSDWVQTNFNKSKSGFVILEFQEDRLLPKSEPHFFKWIN